jgi:hypothetical protein
VVQSRTLSCDERVRTGVQRCRFVGTTLLLLVMQAVESLGACLRVIRGPEAIADLRALCALDPTQLAAAAVE